MASADPLNILNVGERAISGVLHLVFPFTIALIPLVWEPK